LIVSVLPTASRRPPRSNVRKLASLAAIRVTPGSELRREIAAVRAARHVTESAGVLVRDHDRDAGKRAALFVGDLPADFRRALLREERCGRREEKCRENRYERNSAHFAASLDIDVDVGIRKGV